MRPGPAAVVFPLDPGSGGHGSGDALTRWVSQLLEQQGHEVVAANARKVRLIHTRGVKDDRLDAEVLDRLARSDLKLLAPIEHLSEEVARKLAVVMHHLWSSGEVYQPLYNSSREAA